MFDTDIRACDWSRDGAFIVVGDVNGFIYLVDPNNLSVLDKKNSKFAVKTKTNSNWIEEIKFSPDS